MAVIQQGLESVRVVKAFGRQEMEEGELDLASRKRSRPRSRPGA